MSKIIDFDKPLSTEDRDWLKERSQGYLVEENDRKFGKESKEPKVDKKSGSQELETTGAPANWEEGTEPKIEYVARPYDPAVSGHFGPESEETAAAEAEAAAVEEDLDTWTVDELKDELRAIGESTSGNKDELVKRLRKAQ
jgi:SAP domain